MKLDDIPYIDIADIETIKRKEKDIKRKHSPICPCCQSDNIIGISRVVGYFSVIENWNVSKQQELKARQKGNYWSINGDERNDESEKSPSK